MYRRKTEQTYSVDRMMRDVARSLIRDFRKTLDDPGFCSDHYAALSRNDATEIRSSVEEPNFELNTYHFKCKYQVSSVLKRYRFETDLYSDQELIEKSIQTFKDTQDRIAKLDLDNISAFSNLILDRAAIYVSRLLGPYDDAEHRDLCRFGRRASIGIPARKACEAARWELPISGSLNQISWFDAEMASDLAVQDYWARQKSSDPTRSTYQEYDSLRLTLVPKSFKSFRSIMPNTTIGSYMSYGLGEMIRKRLKKGGYDISKLQMQHRDLARRGSLHNGFATVDLSSASDSISVALVRRLFPPDWFDILNQSRVGKVSLPDGSEVESLTFCTMGIGYTFPLQTMVFLSLLHAIRYTLYGPRNRSTISVYGDDMIYNAAMHSCVVEVFEEIGFVINVDKTFYDGPFRESCGGDYHRGVDVRPFQPRNGPANVDRKTYEAVLYKCVNGLLARWSEYEIGGTLNYLLSELGSITGKAKLVPAEYPDESGIKIPCLDGYEFLRNRDDVVKPVHVGHGVYRFSYLRLKPERREELRHEPYYWLALRSLLSSTLCIDWKALPDRRGALQRHIDDVVGVKTCEPQLIIAEVQPKKAVRSKVSGRRLRRKSTFVTVSHTGRYTRQSGTSCFGVPQS